MTTNTTVESLDGQALEEHAGRYLATIREQSDAVRPAPADPSCEHTEPCPCIARDGRTEAAFLHRYPHYFTAPILDDR